MLLWWSTVINGIPSSIPAVIFGLRGSWGRSQRTCRGWGRWWKGWERPGPRAVRPESTEFFIFVHARNDGSGDLGTRKRIADGHWLLTIPVGDMSGVYRNLDPSKCSVTVCPLSLSSPVLFEIPHWAALGSGNPLHPPSYPRSLESDRTRRYCLILSLMRSGRVVEDAGCWNTCNSSQEMVFVCECFSRIKKCPFAKVVSSRYTHHGGPPGRSERSWPNCSSMKLRWGWHQVDISLN